jgi:hypothetical protein
MKQRKTMGKIKKETEKREEGRKDKNIATKGKKEETRRVILFLFLVYSRTLPAAEIA